MGFLFMYSFFVMFHSVSLQEVAVIIGGRNESQPFVNVEVYRDWLNHELKCPETEEDPSIPNFPIPIHGASAIYLPGIGIYVCGGVNAITEAKNHDCYKYNPKEKR